MQSINLFLLLSFLLLFMYARPAATLSAVRPPVSCSALTAVRCLGQNICCVVGGSCCPDNTCCGINEQCVPNSAKSGSYQCCTFLVDCPVAPKPDPLPAGSCPFRAQKVCGGAFNSWRCDAAQFCGNVFGQCLGGIPRCSSSTPGSTPPSTPGSTPPSPTPPKAGSTPGPTPGSTPGPTPGSTPGSTPTSVLASSPGSTPSAARSTTSPAAGTTPTPAAGTTPAGSAGGAGAAGSQAKATTITTAGSTVVTSVEVAASSDGSVTTPSAAGGSPTPSPQPATPTTRSAAAGSREIPQLGGVKGYILHVGLWVAFAAVLL